MMEAGILQLAVKVAAVVGGGLISFYLVFYILKRWSARKKVFIPALLEKHIHHSGELLFLTITLSIIVHWFKSFISEEAYGTVVHISKILLIIGLGYFILRVVSLLYDLVIRYYKQLDFKDYTLRSAKTKFHLLRRMLHITVVVLCSISIMMTFDAARQLGNTFLASAGVAGIVIGFAAQKSLSTFFAGIQIAITQPIKLDDTVVVENTFGNIGEITLTYVVINTWDEKRLIVPINYFLENSFENWTRLSPEVLAQVKIYADYTFPVDQAREQFNKWLSETELWDKRKSNLLVTGSDDKTIEIRMSMSAANSDDAWDLECLIREKMITYTRQNFPNTLPVTRMKIREQPL